MEDVVKFHCVSVVQVSLSNAEGWGFGWCADMCLGLFKSVFHV
jgi:hypothetical protein